MAKQIKAIKCPQCGSTDKAEVKPDYFRCNNCNTEYFLDNEDITIYHRVEYDEAPPRMRPPATPVNAKRGIRVFLIIMISIWVIFLVIKFVSPNATSSPPAFSQREEKEFSWFFNDKAAYISAEGKPIEVVIGERMYMGSAHETKKGVYAAFYDLQSGKELSANKVPGVSNDVSGGKYAAATFENGDLYFIVEKTRIFKVDKSSLSINDVTQSLFSQHPELTSGIANAEFIYKSDGEGFNLIANDGVNYYYYPLQDRLYTKEQKSAAEEALEKASAGETLKTAFAFSRASTDYPEEKRQLIKYVRRDPKGGPDEEPGFEWSKDYSTGSRSLLRWGSGVVRTFKDFTPGRQYFDPKVLYSDDEVVLLWYANTPAEKSGRSLQCLNASTAAIIFTLPLASDYYLGGALRYKDGFVIDNNTSMLLVSTAGKLITEFKTN